jgi:hypothetical protein
MPGFHPPQDYVFFADESGITQCRFMAVGGLSVRGSYIPHLHSAIQSFREKHGMQAELKWSKVSPQKLEEYKALVDIFFAHVDNNKIHFHAVFADSHQLNHKKFNGGDRDSGLSKLYYQLILHKFGRRYERAQSMCVVLDHRNSTTSLHDLKRMINLGLAKHHGERRFPVKQIVSRDSKSDCILQLNDVILGAACAVRNGRHLLEGGNAAKRAVALYVLEKSGHAGFDTDSPANVNRFTAWNIKLRK